MKRICPMFSRIIEHDKCQGSFFKGSQDVLSFTVELLRAFFKDLRGCWKHKFLKKKAFFPVKKKLFDQFFACYRAWQNWRNNL